MRLIEVGARGAGCLFHVVALIHVLVHAEAELLGGGFHELPESTGIGRGHRIGQSRLDDGEILEVHRYARIHEDGLDEGEPPAGPLEGQQAAAVPEGPDEQLLLHPLPHTEALEGQGGAGELKPLRNAGRGHRLWHRVQTGFHGGGRGLADRSGEGHGEEDKAPGAQQDEAAEVDPGRHQKGESKSAKRPAAASLGESRGCSTPQSMPRSGSSQRRERSCSGL